jgi:histidinol phosphatase-like enzyme
MKAVFVHRNCVLRDSHIDLKSAPDTWHLMPATLEAIRLLADEDTLLFLFDPVPHGRDGDASDHGLETLVEQVQAAGGRVDGLISCGHGSGELCRCWGESPTSLWVAASRFDLRLEECYLLGDAEQDLLPAHAAGVRPFVVLCARSIGEVLGDSPAYKDCPIAADLNTAVHYVTVEEEIKQQLGHPRDPARPAPPREVLYATPEALPTITVTSPLARSVQARVRSSRLQLRDIARWLSFLVLGAVGLSLGIAYMLTHLYRVQPFPEFVYYVTLQFIPRPLRGALFIVWGVGALLLALRSFRRAANLGLWDRRRTQ